MYREIREPRQRGAERDRDDYQEARGRDARTIRQTDRDGHTHTHTDRLTRAAQKRTEAKKHRGGHRDEQTGRKRRTERDG